MKNESQLPRLIALALIAVIILLACTGAFARPAPAPTFQPVSPNRRC